MRRALAAVVAILFIVMNFQTVSASISSSPASVSDNIASSATESWNIGITPNENLHNVTATIVGSNADNDAVLQAMLTIWPKYWATIDNGITENTTLTANTTGIAVGTYSGTIEVVANENTKSIPLTFTVGAPATPTTGLTPSRGRIVATMPSTSTLSKSIVITNLTGQSLTSIDAYMDTTELYGPAGTDWVIVQFEAPYSLAHAETFTVTADIRPQSVPNGEHIRTLVVEGWYGTTQVTADIIIRITIYGAVTVVNETTIVMKKDGEVVTDVTAGSSITFTLDPATDAKIYAGGILLGTANENGVLTADAPDDSGSYTIEARADNGSTIGSADLDVSEYKTVSIVLDQVEVSVGSPVTGTIQSGSQGIGGIKVTLNGTEVFTDVNGSFSIPTTRMSGAFYEIETYSLQSGLVTYRPATGSVILAGGGTASWVWVLVIVILISAGVGAFMLWRDGRLNWLEDAIKKFWPRSGKPKFPSR